MKKENEPKYIQSPLGTNMINYRVYYMSAKERIITFILSFFAGGLCSLIFYGGLFKNEDGDATFATVISNIFVFILVGLIVAKFAFPIVKSMLFEKRNKKLRKQFMDMLETISTLLSSGSTVNDAFYNAEEDLQNQYTENDHIILELKEIKNGIDNGKTLEEMLNSFGERSNNKDIKSFANVIGNCYRLGGNFKTVVRRTRDIISDKIQIEEEIATKISSNKIQLNAMSLMPIVLVGLLKISSADFAANLASLKGVLVTTLSIVLFLIAYCWGRKIIEIS